MKFTFFPFLFFIFLFQQRLFAQDSKIETQLILTEDITSNFKGGIKKATGHLGNIDFILTADLWKNGQWFVYGLYNYGNASSAWVGDLQVTNNIEALSRPRLYQFWYQHQFDQFTVTLGQHDLNSVFAVTDYGSTFINSSFGIQPDLSVNAPFSIFPVAAPGAILAWRLNDFIQVSAAIYDGDPGAEEDNPNSLQFHLGRNDGSLMIAELQYQNPQATAKYKLGYWKSSTAYSRSEVHGFYGIIDQQLYQHPAIKSRGLGAFMQWGMASKSAPVLRGFYSLGLVATGVFGATNEDAMGLAFGSASVSSLFQREVPNSSSEHVLEFHYTYTINERWSVQPNLQWVINPGATNALDDALIGVLRITATIF